MRNFSGLKVSFHSSSLLSIWKDTAPDTFCLWAFMASSTVVFNEPSPAILSVSVPPPMHLPPMKTRGTVRAPVMPARMSWTSASTSGPRVSSSQTPKRMPCCFMASFAFVQNGHQDFEKTITGWRATISSTLAFRYALTSTVCDAIATCRALALRAAVLRLAAKATLDAEIKVAAEAEKLRPPGFGAAGRMGRTLSRDFAPSCKRATLRPTMPGRAMLHAK
mmetsp:Transcript_62690/g.117275  ORF Transcript_62690/g.117275 Transcript_62690/m.117275 type:complete len:221 (-) Transcript_62690:12-674(-)